MNRCLLSLLVCICFSNASAQQTFRTTSPSTIAYLEYLPPDYHTNSDPYPILFFLHGNGEKGANSTDTTVLKQYINLVTKHGPPKYIKAGHQFPFIVISPQLKSGGSNWTSAYVMEVINHCKRYLRVDEKRIYITGLSLGGGGTWVTIQDNPSLFAAAAPVCGGYNSTSKACPIAAENLPVWAFHGDRDTVVPLSRSQAMVNAINACVPAPSPSAKLTIYPGVGHNAWDYAYRTDNTLHTPNLYEWLQRYTNTKSKGNYLPVANAGTDIVVSGATTTIAGRGADQDGSIVKYEWSRIKGAQVQIADPSQPSLSVSGLALGSYVFRLQVTDNSGNTDSDYVKLSVVNNKVPSAIAGDDKQIVLPNAVAVLSGTGIDPDGTITEYQWTKTAGPEAVLSGTRASSLTVTDAKEGLYTFRLTVKDNLGASASDEVSLEVKPMISPTVNAGKDKIVRLPSSSTSFAGTATDDGTISSWSWTKLAGPVCTLSNASTSTLRVGGLTQGTYSFRLTVKDNNGNVSFDDVTLNVTHPPLVNAGEDRTIYLPQLAALVLQGTATDADGTIQRYQWSKTSGPSMSMTGGSTPTPSITKLLAGTYVFKLAATDNVGATSVDYVTISVLNASPVKADAGLDRVIKLPTTSASLTGTATTTSGGTIVRYEWIQIAGPVCTLTGVSTTTLKLSNLVSGTYTFRLKATDTNGYSASDDVLVTVNAPPVVDAGTNLSVNLPLATPVTLNGKASDPDGTIVKYLWSKHSGPNVTVSGTTTTQLTISAAVEGTYVFKLAVTDHLGATGVDYVTVTVSDPAGTASAARAESVQDDPMLAFSKPGVQDSSAVQETVLLYNASGKRIYAGEWSEDIRNQQLANEGLYFLKRIRAGKVVETTRIYQDR